MMKKYFIAILSAIIMSASNVSFGDEGSNKNFLANLQSIAPMIVIMVVFYFVLILPQSRRKKKQEEMLSSLKKGEEVMTASGIFGKIVGFEEKSESIFIEVDQGVKIKLLKSQIVNILSRKNPETNTAKAIKN